MEYISVFFFEKAIDDSGSILFLSFEIYYYHGQDHNLLSFLDFAGFKFDEHDCDSVNLRLQFAHYRGARSGGGHLGKR